MEFIGGRSHRRAAWTHIRERENEGRTEDGGVVCGIGAVTTETSQLTAQPSGDGARRRKENRGTRGDRQDDRLRAQSTNGKNEGSPARMEIEEEARRSCLT